MASIIRLATQQDIPDMLAIYTPYVLETNISFETEPPTAEQFSSRLAARQHAFPWLVYIHENQIMGYAYASRFGERAGYNWSVEGSVYVSSASRGKGVGRALYTALIRLLQKQGYRSLYALVATPNPESEIFHQKFGFQQQGLLPQAGYKFGKVVGVAYYAKNLLPFGKNLPSPKPVTALDESEIERILLSSFNN